MSQAEALLNSMLATTAVETEQPNTVFTEVEPHIVIGIDRFIIVPDELKRIAVQYDHNMRTVTFDCPRYYDGRDMSKMKVYINIAGPNGTRSSYIADNVKVDYFDTNIMHFDWTITRAITEDKGNMAFLVCIRKADSDGNEENHWNSELNTEMYISEGMEYEESFEYEYPDIVSQLLQRMDDVEGLATPEAMQGYADTWLNEHGNEVIAGVQTKGDEVLATIPADYTTAANNANEGVRTKADAIIRTVEGETITVSDSSDDYLRGLRVFGKTEQDKTTGAQLADYTGGNCASGVTKTFENDVLTVSGNGSLSYQSWSTSIKDVIDKHPGEKLHFDCEKIETVNSPDGTIVQLNITKSDGSREYIALYNKSGDRNIYDIPTDTSTVTAIAFSVYTSNHATASVNTVTITKPMLQIGAEKIPYEPYSGGVASPHPDWPQELNSVENPTISMFGKNLLEVTAVTQTINGITFTVNEDKSVTMNGTATADAYCGLNQITMYKPGKYVLSGCVNGGSNTYFLYSDVGGIYNRTGETEFTIDAYEQRKFLIKVHSGITVSNVTIKPMLRLVDTRDGTYESYKERFDIALAHTLPGIPVSQNGNYTDDNGQQWICDEIDFERGVYVQRIGIETFDGSDDENWYLQYLSSNPILEISPTFPKQSIDGFCTHYRSAKIISSTKELGYSTTGSAATLRFRPDDYATITNNEWKARLALSPVTATYVLTTPIETPLSAEELEAFKQARSNYHNTVVLNDVGAQMELKYNADTEIYINNVINNAMMKITNITLPFANWIGTTYGYSQTVSIPGLTPNSKIDLQPTPDQLANFVRSGVSLTTSNENGIVTIHAIDNCPTSDITLQVQITEVITV